MNVFYNKQYVGDVFLIQLTTEQIENVTTETFDDVIVIHDEKSKDIVGFNIFNASKYAVVEGEGQIELTEELVEKLQAALDQNNISYTFHVDLTPKFVVGFVQSKDQHPNADKLSVCQVDVESETLQIVCGAKNIDAGQKVVVAKVGAVMPSGMIIRDGKLRGVESSGMICSESELNLPNAKQDIGILVLEDDAVVGEQFVF